MRIAQIEMCALILSCVLVLTIVPGLTVSHAAVMEYKTVRGTEPEELANRPIKELDSKTFRMQDAKTPILQDAEASINGAHGRLEIRYQKLHSIKRVSSKIG